MKKILFLLAPLILLASQQNSYDTQLKNLHKEIEELKKTLQEHQSDLDESMPILEETEKKSILDKINFSPELLLRIDQMNYSNGKIGPNGDKTLIYNHPDSSLNGLPRRDRYTKNFEPSGYVRFRLNMQAEFEDVKFYGRLLYANSSQSNERLCILSRDIKSATGGSAFDVDKAYIDYTPQRLYGGDFTFTFGVLPTSGGTPMQYAQNKKRASMFPALVFDMNTYGMIATQKVMDASYLRLVVAKAYTLRDNFYPYQCNRERIDNANIFGFYADTSFDFYGNALISYGVNILESLKAHPFFGPDIDSSHAHDLGTMLTYGIGIDVENVLGSKHILFAHTAVSNPYPNGNKDDYQIDSADPAAGLTLSGYPGFTEEEYASGEMISKNGFSFYLGGKLTLTPTLHVGAEYNYGSKYWFAATQGAEDLFNKLATRGEVVELYTSWQFQKYLNAKVGYLYIEEKYTGSGWHFGTPQSKDARQNIYSLSLEARF